MTEAGPIASAQKLAETVTDAPRYVVVAMATLTVALAGMAALWHLATLLIAQCVP